MSNHTKFLSHLSDSVDGVSFAAQWLMGQGYGVQLNPSTVAETAADWQNHADSGDLYVLGRVEVKQLGYDFSSTHWPFGEYYIVCEKRSYDRAKPKPHAYISISKDRKCIAVVKSASRPSWYVQSRGDHRYDGDYTQERYFAPLEYVSFYDLPDVRKND